MLQHYSPYKVAENFNLLAALAPGRIDLGVGKAPGGLPLSTRALQQGLHQEEKGTFADQLAQLDNWLSLTEPGERRACAPRRSAAPGRRISLGASPRVRNWPPVLTGTSCLRPISMATARCAAR